MFYSEYLMSQCSTGAPQWERSVYTVEEAGTKLGIGRNSAYEAVKRGDIPHIRIGKRILIPKTPFDRMLGEVAGGEAA
jgi:excisionase family DNA binding protein